ncbi:hydrolase [Endozoicomonas montiporae]|uniref:Hydrolase n=2 Tax=Endozoicomonas montiporae TaxID=1027273 RepID=A0A081N1Y6_9GAMM|nr:HD domain-containing protein [Endozoicomonas montiporae]AMO58590.1 hypothetical protein EZMO1_4685 [Endozoicomonas montiporae CL-33]KEQ12459.1 hydrolase [Endozoicomonas montiporae]
MSAENLKQQIEFINELDKLKSVYRQTMVKSENSRQENSAEHSWHIAMMATLLVDYVSKPVDIHRVTIMLLIHDIVEIDAGDAFVFDANQVAGQEDKEIKAAERLFGLLPECQRDYVMALWQEFEALETHDARFAKAMDCMLPLLQNMDNNGGSWSKHSISRAQVLKRNQYLESVAPELHEYALSQIDLAVEKGWLKP